MGASKSAQGRRHIVSKTLVHFLLQTNAQKARSPAPPRFIKTRCVRFQVLPQAASSRQFATRLFVQINAVRSDSETGGHVGLP